MQKFKYHDRVKSLFPERNINFPYEKCISRINFVFAASPNDTVISKHDGTTSVPVEGTRR